MNDGAIVVESIGAAASEDPATMAG
jgi:hypothetical protein